MTTAEHLLDELHEALERYVVMPSEHAAYAVTAWIAASHAIDAFQYAPRLCVSAPLKRCGKSRLLDVIEATCHDPLMTVNATPAAVYRRIGDGRPPTLLIDEADALWGTKKSAEQNEDLRALVNAGHQRGRPALRCVGPQQTPTEFATFAMVALAGIGNFPDTITDRAVNVVMRRRAPGEYVDNFRHRRDALPLHDLRDRLATWAKSAVPELMDAEPDMPVEDRAADTWEPLVVVADAAGGPWPARIRTAAVTMTADAIDDETETQLGVRMLADCRTVFGETGDANIKTQRLVELLREVDEAPWRAFDLDDRDLAWRLRQYGIRSTRIRVDGVQARGYRLEDFADSFARYLPDGASQPVTASFAQVNRVTASDGVTDASVTVAGSVTPAHASDLHERAPRDGVTVRDAPTGATCVRCGEAMVRTAAWQTTHPTCDPMEAAS